MINLESICLSKLKFRVPFFYRYVDDIITCVPTDKVNEIVDVFNDFHPRLKFTYELENKNSIPFLDVLLIHHNNKIKFNWYRKPTWSGRLVNFNSNNPISQKKAVVKNLVDRAIKVSDSEFHTQNLNLIEDILMYNDYPRWFFECIIKKRYNSICKKTINNITNISIDMEKTVILPYSLELNKKIESQLKPYNIKVINKSDNKIGKYIRSTKDKIPFDLKSSLVYKIPCKNCVCCYIGQTKRTFADRKYEHNYSQKHPEKNIKTALSDHAKINKHEFEFNKAIMLESEENQYKRDILECFHIKRHDNTVNYKQDTKKLSNIYDPIIYIK